MHGHLLTNVLSAVKRVTAVVKPKDGENRIYERRSTILILSVVMALIIAVVCFAVYLTRIQWKATTSTIKTASLAATECVSSAIYADQLILSDIALLVGKSNSRDRAELLDGVQAETSFRESLRFLMTEQVFRPLAVLLQRSGAP